MPWKCQKAENVGLKNFKSYFVQAMSSLVVKQADSVDWDEVAHNEPPHLDLHC